ncbi:HAMP domain-containing protein [Alteromonas sp. 5E99-2]|uniref:ATP-binding protein n=1 Tax=Alteromonas sp. 5E99-2 TaxID=2817683 RepID=UPI001A99E20A|nr:ATP-binding protein [Alteromonas sp. 5E99-2]MBO1254617.1 HAMP domain-containing protein [Alteromonas sp. 5E99-2]
MRLTAKLASSVGFRLLAGFWVTIALALLCVWLISRWSILELGIANAEQDNIDRLSRVVKRVEREYAQHMPLARLVRPIGGRGDASAVLVDIEKDKVIGRRGPFRERIQRDVSLLSGQSLPQVLKRRQYTIIGPQRVQLGSDNYLLFILENTPNRRNSNFMIAALLLALFGLSLVFSVIFTKSLLRPIRALRHTALELTNGQWDARVDEKVIQSDELGELANTFNSMAKKIEDNWHSQRRLLADVSHELRSPLARLNMAVALAENATKESTSAQQSLQRIEKETQKMDYLIRDVLTLSRTEAGMAAKTKISVEALLDEVIQNGKFEASQTGVELKVAGLPTMDVLVQVDAMESAIENILRNAIRYAYAHVEFSVIHSSSSLKFIISDDGPGLPESDLTAIFAPFFRADSARNSETGGIGLGLAIAKAAVSIHDGQIEAKNNPEKGLQVVVTIPVLSL